MALTKVSTDGVKDDAITSGKIPANAVGASELADNAVDTNAIANNAVTAGKTSGVRTTINNQANNRLISMTGTTNVLDAEANLTFDDSHLILGNGKGIRTNYIRPTDGSSTNTGGASQQYYKLGDITLNGSEAAVITLFGANGYSSGGSNFAGETTIVLRGGNANTLLGFWYSDSGTGIATYSDVRWKYTSGTTYELWVSAGNFNNIAPIVKTTGTFDNTNAAATGSNTEPSGSTALPTGYCKQVGTIQTIEYQSTGTIFKRNVVMANGYGIDFSATSGTGTSELFDDYEEGSWTPTGGTNNEYSLAGTIFGRYIKVGRVVHAWAQFGTDTSGNVSTGDIIVIKDLPFSASTGETTNAAASFTINYNLSNYSTLSVTHITNSTQVKGIVAQTTGHARTGAGYYMQVTYMTT